MARRVPFRFGPPEPPPPPKPFTVLTKPRFIPPGWPSDITAWYRAHEGVGLKGSSIHSVRVFKFAELRPIHAADIALFCGTPDPKWEDFRAIRIAIGNDLEEIVYTIGGKVHRFGSVLALGQKVINSGVLVLDLNFIAWMARLKRDDWVEYGIATDKIETLKGGKANALRRQFERLNPGMVW